MLSFFGARFAKFALRKLCSGFPVSCPRSLSMMLNVCVETIMIGALKAV